MSYNPLLVEAIMQDRMREAAAARRRRQSRPRRRRRVRVFHRVPPATQPCPA